jgi:amidase/aspartyl-tRNA(Asn)/glutamyl-tRNA(Gln) amidotransferase subunit A
MTFGEWQQLGPEAAAREVLRRAEALLPLSQRRSAIAALRSLEDLEAAFGASPKAGPLHGIPYLLKDLFDAQGMPTRGGSSFLAEVRPVPAEDSRIVRDLRAAGAVLAGKAHLFEFAWGLTGENAHYGDCEHPRFPGRTSGGSSSGSAVAVAAGIVPFAVGTDTGGSIRVPSAFCGVYGYRGVPGDVRITDAVPLAPIFDTAGWFTRTAGDMRTAMAALVGLATAERAPTGCYLEMPGVDRDVALACRSAALVFTEPADEPVRASLQEAFSPAAEIYGVLAGVETRKIHRKWADRYRARYGPLVQARLDRARAISPAQVAAVEPSQATLLRAWGDYFKSRDFLVMPAAPCTALGTGELTPANRLRMLGLTAPASLARLPALTIPVTLPSGLSAGIQVVFSRPDSPVVGWVLEALGHSSA